jgi:DNA-directed RNA polymerase subunit M/transcription elongation factor TFIIS
MCCGPQMSSSTTNRMAIKNEDQAWCLLLEKRSDPSVRDQWKTNVELKTARDRFINVLIPTNPTRRGCLCDALEYVRKYSTDVSKWIAYFYHPPFLTHLIPLMAQRNEKDKRIELLFTKTLNWTTDSPTVQQPVSLEKEKELLLEKQRERLNDAFIKGGIPVEQLEELSFVCSCGRKGTIDYQSSQIRRADEGATMFLKCQICTSQSKS